MNWTQAESSFITEVAYEYGNLYVKFKGGNIVSYKDFPSKKYDEFLKSPSKGKFFMAEIKDKFTEQKFEG